MKDHSDTARSPVPVLMLALVLAGCGAIEESGPELAAPPSIDATLLQGPRILHVGEIVEIEIVVVTPPDHRLRPITPHRSAGLSLVGMHAPEVEPGTRRWIHRTRFRLRADTVGPKEWPATALEVEDASGAVHRIEVAAHAFEVSSVHARFPGRDQPFGFEEPPVREARGPGSFGLGLASGLGLSLAIALVAWVTRRALRSGRRDQSAEVVPPIDLFEWTSRELAETHEILDAEAPGSAQQAAAAGAHLIRVYMARRFGSDTEAATTEELEQREPALAERALWPDFVRILRALDGQRFRPARDAEAGESTRVRAALEDGWRLMEASRPRGAQGG